MTFLQFADKSVPYGVFVKDVAAQVLQLLKRMMPTPDYISQNEAFPASVDPTCHNSRQSIFEHLKLYNI